MSRCYSIACTQCRKHLWIAQAGIGGYCLYYGQPHTMKALRDFLFEHALHPLVFDENEEGEVSEMEEVEVTEPKEIAYTFTRFIPFTPEQMAEIAKINPNPK